MKSARNCTDRGVPVGNMKSRDLGKGATMLMHRLKDASSLGLSCTYAKPLHGCRGLLADTLPFFSGISFTLSTFPNDSNLLADLA